MKALLDFLNTSNSWTGTLSLQRNDFLKNGGTVDTNLYYILSGSVKVFLVHQNEEHVVRLGYTGNFIAALDSLITQKKSEFYIQALKKTTIKFVSRKTVFDWINADISHRILWEDTLQQLILQHIEREKDLLCTKPKERYLNVLKRSPQVFQHIPHKHIAAYLRMTPETLSRLQKS